MTYEPRFDIDRQMGEESERRVATVLGWLLTGDKHLYVEVKAKSYIDDWLYVEVEHRPPGAGEFRPSGISVTEAHVVAYAIPMVGVVLFFPTALVRSALAAGLGRPVEERDGDCPTHGRLIRVASLLSLARQEMSA
jgi:hypothetical protein